RVDTIVLDKTGTLTLGDPRIVGVYPAEGILAAQLVEAAAIAELPSEHPLGKAVLARARADGIRAPEPDHFSSMPGKGLVCRYRGETIVVGNRELLDEQGVSVPEAAFAASTVLVARG